MGAADIVPGVSGGTVALVLGIYEQFLDNIRMGAKCLIAALKFDFPTAIDRFKKIEFGFIIPLFGGLFFAIAILTSLIEGWLANQPEEIAGFFFGLVIASIIVAWGLMHTTSFSENSTELLVILGVGLLAFYLLGFQSGPVSDPPLWAYLVAGSIAICAMILPGISGSFILLMMGMYAAILSAVHDFDIAALGLFLIGAVIGLAIFSNILGHLIDNYHDLVLATLIGLMAGSLRVLWPWPNGVGLISEEADEVISGTALGSPAGNFVMPTLFAVGAFVIVIAFTKFASSFEKDAESSSLA